MGLLYTQLMCFVNTPKCSLTFYVPIKGQIYDNIERINRGSYGFQFHYLHILVENFVLRDSGTMANSLVIFES